jgi:transcription elongation factor Elf1
MAPIYQNKERYTGESECPQCGLGSAGLKPECLAFVIKRFGATVLLACDICGNRWIQEEKL